MSIGHPLVIRLSVHRSALTSVTFVTHSATLRRLRQSTDDDSSSSSSRSRTTYGSRTTAYAASVATEGMDDRTGCGWRPRFILLILCNRIAGGSTSGTLWDSDTQLWFATRCQSESDWLPGSGMIKGITMLMDDGTQIKYQIVYSVKRKK